MKFSWAKFFIKLSSRKFWIALASFIVSTLGMFGYNSELLVKISSLILMFGTIVIYFISDMIETKNGATCTPVEITPITPDDILIPNDCIVPDTIASQMIQPALTSGIDPAETKFF